MRIAFFTEGYDPFINGAVTSIKTLRSALDRQGHEVVIFTPACPGYDDRDPQVRRLPGMQWNKNLYPLLSPLAYRTDPLSDESFDVIHSHHPFTMSRLAARLAGKHDLPLIYTFHTLLHEYGHYVPFLPAAGRYWLTRQYLRHCAEADVVHTATEAVRHLLLQQGVQTQIEVAPLGVPAVSPAAGAREAMRKSLGISPRTPLLLYVGRLAREKGLELLLRAVARLAAGRGFHLCLVGGGPMEGRLRELARDLGLAQRVTFSGWVRHEEIGGHYAAADVFVLPSPAETMGLVLVEAMSAGLPCVAIDKYGPSEVVVDGLTGFLTPFDEGDFGEAIQRLLDNAFLCQRMATAARARACDFHPDVAAAAMVRVYEDAIADRERLRLGSFQNQKQESLA